jgi:hypothetical protein
MQKPGLFGMNGLMLFLLNCFSFVAHAQQTGYLILLDAENKQAFTIRIGDQMFASSGHGHLVISHLKDSSYRLNLSFPKKNFGEQVFPVVIHQKDLGFQLKGNDSSWVLYNWQTKESIRPVNERDSSRILDMGVKREDGFSRLMASVVNDSSVMYNTYTGNGFSRDSSTARILPSNTPALKVLAKAAQPPTKDSLLSASRQLPTVRLLTKDSLISATSPGSVPNKTPVGKIPIASSQQPVPDKPALTMNPPLSTKPAPGIKKLREVSLKISRKIVFLDISKDGQADTITLFVFYETTDTILKKQPPTDIVVAKRLSKPDSTSAKAVTASSKPALKSLEPGCSRLATDEDVEFLRSAILKANSEQEKIAVANSAFEFTCFSVSQVRLLAGLFVSDKGKYRLMDAAHLHIADREHFHELVDMLTDKNFQRKFLVMADKRT